MEKENILLTEFKLWIADYLGLPREKINLNSSFAELGIDSNVAMELVFELEEVLGREITTQELHKTKTLLELLQSISAELSQRES